MPEPPPVTTASLPENESIARHLPYCNRYHDPGPARHGVARQPMITEESLAE